MVNLKKEENQSFFYLKKIKQYQYYKQIYKQIKQIMNFLNKLTKTQSIPVIYLNGVINDKLAQKVTKGLQRINPKSAKAVAVVVNSPGGAAVQSDLIASQIQRYCKQHKLPLYTFADDMAASGGYMILSIGDKVYVDQGSLVGSIGVIGSYMKVGDLLNSKNVETRNFSTQENLIENLFSPVTKKPSEQNVDKFRDLLKSTHKTFIEHVESNRGDKITLSQEQRQQQIYNADVFGGEKAVEYGLADAVGNYQNVLLKEFPQASLDFVIKKTLRERFNEKGVMFNIQLPGFNNQAQEQNLSQTMTSEFLKQFKN
ncbi:hypothetical protein PPERSA_00404 [Pseudocohnilembus persalinus]|uniref:Peptidase S49 domain-containing protein n=1 Tax=Pseudocohnilembus persalinus TaxID=266149 RepID=A0A0V0QY25_PSEPJ|nr:hypothetical protein PPERSA_00404 [Pseudocohnilembus persalinus]|eukprot:KRX07247.1 hypothetical protein PPERSA_00404 [Pseudocohnilembus persalinus]